MKAQAANHQALRNLSPREQHLGELVYRGSQIHCQKQFTLGFLTWRFTYEPLQSQTKREFESN
jgi:hypothetical protein